MGQPEKARTHFNAHDLHVPTRMLAFAKTLQKERKPADAIRLLKDVATKFDRDSEEQLSARWQLSACYEAVDDGPAALRQLQVLSESFARLGGAAAHDLPPGRVQVLLRRGAILAKQHKLVRALEALRGALALEPENDEAPPLRETGWSWTPSCHMGPALPAPHI